MGLLNFLSNVMQMTRELFAAIEVDKIFRTLIIHDCTNVLCLKMQQLGISFISVGTEKRKPFVTSPQPGHKK
jgi:hypothetical protein